MSRDTESHRQVLQQLRKESPYFHGRKQAGTKSFALQPSVLNWIIANITEGAVTLETGCGYSTVLLASLSRHHTVISPFEEEHVLIRTWCHQHGISTDHVEFIAKPSQEIVCTLESRELDFVLIDGDHAFPAPFIDWYYTADKVRAGGYLAVDDTHIPTGKILRDFLAAEAGRWKLTKEIGKTAIFSRSTTEPVALGIEWMEQPFCRLTRRYALKQSLGKNLKGFLKKLRV